MWGKQENNVAGEMPSQYPFISSGAICDHLDKTAHVWIKINTDAVRYEWSREVPYYEEIESYLDREALQYEIELWTSLVRRLVRMSKLEKE